jgi:HlyD family secretion protein
MLRWILPLAVVVAGTAGIWWYLQPAPVTVAVASVARGPVAATVANTRAGTVDACRRAGLSPALGGQISALPVRDGATVAAGDLLLELWNVDIKAELERVRRDASAAISRSRESCVIADVAKREAERLTTLRERGLTSEEAADQATGRAESTAAACLAARDTAQVTAAQINVVEAQLERTQLRAPFDGVIAEINGELGEFVTPSPVGIPTPPTVDLIDSSCLFISAPIDEVDAPAITTGLLARISLDAFPNRIFAGHVRRVAPYVLDLEKQARTVEIEAEIDDPDKRGLLPGYSADVEVVLESREAALRIPTAVIRDGRFVYVFDAGTGTVEERAIEIGISNWEFSEIVNGLREGEQIMTSIDRAGVEPGARVEAE